MLQYIVGEKNVKDWSYNIAISNEENMIIVKICYGEGSRDDDNDNEVSCEIFSGMEIDDIFYESNEIQKALVEFFPTTSRAVMVKLNEITDSIGLY
jgi:hypothetical protein